MNVVQATLLGALLGGIIGVVGTYLGAIRIANKQFLIDAGTKFRAAFHDELATLKAQEKIDAINILESAFKKHLIAISEFVRRLPRCKRATFNQAWENYYCHPATKIQHLVQYDTVTGSTDQRKKNRELAIKRIEHILSFSK